MPATATGTGATPQLAAAALVCVAAVALVPPVLVEAQCVMCRTALASEEGRALLAGFRSGIVVLLAAPFAAFGIVAALALRAFQRRARDDLTASGRCRALPAGSRKRLTEALSTPAPPATEQECGPIA